MRGTLRIYLGIAPGVGKTYMMFRAARAERRAGVDVVVAYWERHGRPATAAQLGKLELLPTRTITYRGKQFEDLDVEGVLRRHPALALVDELAHANLPGERHAKRYEDVEEILGEGIDVYTTLNVANIASLGAIVARLTGTRRVESVPDEFVRSGEIKLVNLEPWALRHRLSEGLVFPKDRAETALAHYFQFANLTALQELAQLWLDDTVIDAAATYRREHGLGEHHHPGVVLVALDGSSVDEWLVTFAAERAEINGAKLRGVHVSATGSLSRSVRSQLKEDRRLLADHGGDLIEIPADDVAGALIEAAQRLPNAELVIGSPGGSRWTRWLRGSTVGRVLGSSGELPVQVVDVGRPTGKPTAPRRHARDRASREAFLRTSHPQQR